MNDLHNKKLTPISKALRKNMTAEEKRLWYDFLKKLPLTVHRQKVIDSYVVDFYIAEAKLILELDGSGHSVQSQKQRDQIRDYRLESQGFQILRISNKEIQESFSSVCDTIIDRISSLHKKLSENERESI